MMQDSRYYKSFNQEEAESIFEIDFEANDEKRLGDEEKQRIYEELMSLEW